MSLPASRPDFIETVSPVQYSGASFLRGEPLFNESVNFSLQVEQKFLIQAFLQPPSEPVEVKSPSESLRSVHDRSSEASSSTFSMARVLPIQQASSLCRCFSPWGVRA